MSYKNHRVFQWMVAYLVLALLFLGCGLGREFPAAAKTDQNPQGDFSVNASEQDSVETKRDRLPKSFAHNAVMRRGVKEDIKLAKISGFVKWSTSNKKVIKIVSKKKKKCIVHPLKNGKATITAKTKDIKIRFRITVKSGTAFVRAWCKQWVRDYITDDMSNRDKLICASAFLTVSGKFHYGNTSKPEDVISKRMGTCVSGGYLLVQMCKAMGFKAKLRFAAKDKMSRYPAGIVFASQHYNVEVKMKGKKYYVDGTPGVGTVYLCTSKKPIYSWSILDSIPW